MVERVFKGEFWKPCPGTGEGYLCCGYQVLTPQRGCGMYCEYCILQIYFKSRRRVVYSNYSDLEKEVAQKMSLRTGHVVRFGTGEFADSLYDEYRTGLSIKIAETLEPYRNALVEFKTKSADVRSLKRIRSPEKVVIGFSVNTPSMIAMFENGTAPLEQRLDAARECEKMGFLLAFHFDPIFWYDGWEQEYRDVVRTIFQKINEPDKIAWVSMGGFRTDPRLKEHLRALKKDNTLFSGEMIIGTDGKLRYFRPYRKTIYTALREEFERQYPSVTLYLCMESREMWEAAAMSGRIPEGLVRYLNMRAEALLRSL